MYGKMIRQLETRYELRRSCTKNEPEDEGVMQERPVLCVSSYTRKNSGIGVVS